MIHECERESRMRERVTNESAFQAAPEPRMRETVTNDSRMRTSERFSRTFRTINVQFT